MSDTTNIAIANMNEYVLSSPDKPIIGTYALAACIGIIVKDNDGNYAIAHISDNYEGMLLEMIKKLSNTGPMQAMIIPGTYTRDEQIEELINFLRNKDYFLLYDFEIKVQKLPGFKNSAYESIEFGFDTRTEEFIKLDYDKILNKGVTLNE